MDHSCEEVSADGTGVDEGGAEAVTAKGDEVGLVGRGFDVEVVLNGDDKRGDGELKGCMAAGDCVEDVTTREGGGEGELVCSGGRRGGDCRSGVARVAPGVRKRQKPSWPKEPMTVAARRRRRTRGSGRRVV